MTRPRLVSVIMVTFQTGPVWERAVAAVLAQTADVELILVNNGNPPEIEAEMIRRFKDEPLVRLMTGHGNIGSAKARNLGARVARGDILLFLGPDCLLRPDVVFRLLQVSPELPRPHALGARLVDMQRRDVPCARQNLMTPLGLLAFALGLQALFPRFQDVALTPVPKKTASVPAISGDFLWISRADFRAVDGFDEGYFLGPVVMDFCTRLSRFGGRCFFEPSVIVVKDSRQAPPETAFMEKQRVKGLVRFFHENFGASCPQPFLWLFDLLILFWAGGRAVGRWISR